MKEMKVVKGKEADDSIQFFLKINSKMEVMFEIYEANNQYQWYYDVHQMRSDKWSELYLINGKVLFLENKKEEKLRKKVENGFYELLRQIKNHPSYRLKVMHMLNDEIRPIWDKV